MGRKKDGGGLPLAQSCPGCGLLLPESSDPVGASEACRTLFTDMLGRSYNDSDRHPLHQLLVDSYLAQHPDLSERRSVQALSICLMTLCLFVEDGVDPGKGPQLHQRMVARLVFRPLELDPALLHGRMTIADVARAEDPAEYGDLLWSWAAQVWDAWAPHHSTVRGWIDKTLH